MADLSNLARMAEKRDGFIAGPLAAYQQMHDLDDHGMTELLHCTSENITHLKLCKLPRPNHYDQDIVRIAEHVHVDPAVLAQILHSETVEP